MKIEDALNLMGRNPAVDFPWEEALIGLVNSFLPQEAQLDPLTATAMDIKASLATLDAVTQQMILLTSVGGQIGPFSATPAAPAVAAATEKSDKSKRSFNLFMGFGGALVLLAILSATDIGGDNKEAMIEVAKLLKELATIVAPSAFPTQ